MVMSCIPRGGSDGKKSLRLEIGKLINVIITIRTARRNELLAQFQEGKTNLAQILGARPKREATGRPAGG